MMSTGKLVLILILLLLPTVGLGEPAYSEEQKRNSSSSAEPVIWRDPGDVSKRDMRYGPGARHLVPTPPFTFIDEDKSGESPKINVRDARGVKWVVKLGKEAQAETVSTRLVWAVGYFAEEAYYFDRVRIRRLPQLSRGQEFIVRRGTVRGARFEPRRRGIQRGSTWDWDKNPFQGTQELNGLKVIMILLNNYDAHSGNNRVFIVRNPATGTLEAHHYVSDLGATLGKAGGLGGTRSKNDLEDFLSTRFVMGVEDDGVVKFDYDTRPTKLGMFSIVYPPYYRGQVKKEKSMRSIPVEHARWIGFLLSQLTDEQLRQAFEVAKYEPATAAGFVKTLRARIDQLTRL
jgi:hypothetical protein